MKLDIQLMRELALFRKLDRSASPQRSCLGQVDVV
jgi:hypothetical protein